LAGAPVGATAAEKEPPLMLFILLSEAARGAMTHRHDDDIADQVDREVASQDGLLALVLCLSVTVGLAAAGVATMLGAFQGT
jgi:hypothetical protein